MFERVLVPVDHSEKNRRALRQAVEMIDRQQTTIHLVHVIETIQGLDFDELSDFYRDLDEKAQTALAGLADELEADSIPCVQQVVYGNRAAEIIRYADVAGCDLIVMTSHAQSEEHPHAGVGTISHQVALLADCPVLLLR
jgi:nucleotide-binding universal stress UspA family protein